MLGVMGRVSYISPEVAVEYVVVESGFTLSNYGDAGEAGQGAGYIDGDDL